MADEVLYRMEGRTAVITLNRPEARNAVNGALATALRESIEKFEADDEARVAILTGTGQAFCAGMDLKAFSSGEAGGIVQKEGGFAGFVTYPRTKPVIGAVNGFALAGGCELALACDFLVAAETASFGLPEPSRGLFAGAGGVFRLPRRVPYGAALELILTAERIPAAEAHRLGLVNHVVGDDQLLDKALEIAGKIAKNAPLSTKASLELARMSLDATETELWKKNDELSGKVNTSKDAMEGSMAFVEKREPVWKGE